MNQTNLSSAGSAVNSWDLQSWVTVYLVMPSCVIGIPGNLLVVSTLLRSDCRLSSSARLCYVVIASADSVTLLCYFLRNIPYWMPQAWHWRGLPHSSLLACNFTRCMTGFGIGLSTSVLTILCLERTYHVVNPMRARRRRVFRLTKLALAAAVSLQLVLNGLLVNRFTLVLYSSKYVRRSSCRMNSQVFTQVAAILICCCNVLFQLLQASVTVLLLCKITQARRKRLAMLATPLTAMNVRRDKMVTVVVSVMSLADLLVVAPQYVAIALYVVHNFIQFASRGLLDLIALVTVTLGPLDAVLWSKNLFVLLRLSTFRKQLTNCHCLLRLTH